MKLCHRSRDFHLWQRLLRYSAGCDNLLGNDYCGEGTPRRNRRLRRFATLRKFLAIATQNQTSYGFLIIQDGQLPHNNCDGFWLRNPRVHYQLW
jgi:hypothetical protein